MTTSVIFDDKQYSKKDAKQLANDIISDIFSFYFKNGGKTKILDKGSNTMFTITIDEDTNETNIHIRSNTDGSQIIQSEAYAKMFISGMINFFGLNLTLLVTFEPTIADPPITIISNYDGFMHPLFFDINGVFDYMYSKDSTTGRKIRTERKIFYRNPKSIDFLFDRFDEIKHRIELIKDDFLTFRNTVREKANDYIKEKKEERKEERKAEAYKELDDEFEEVNIYLFSFLDKDFEKVLGEVIVELREQRDFTEDYENILREYFHHSREQGYIESSQHSDEEIRKHFSDFEESRIKEIIDNAKRYRKDEEKALALPSDTPDFKKFAEGIASSVVSQLAKMGPASLTQFVQSLNPDRKTELAKLFAQNPELLKDFKTSTAQALLLGLISPNTYKEIIDIPRSSFGSKVKIDQTKPQINENIDRRIIRTNKISYKISGKK